MYNKCHKINNLSGPLGHFLFYVILTISLLAERHHYLTIPRGPCQANRDSFWYTDCIFQL